ncbi:HNH endonuclease [Paenibacillus polymyxa]|uniref:HNH endonuclease n=1 Tax=Paenibacillus polymyxa TaxID=1406 RepID=UPI002378004E|nr:HNH endonuclease [Paenibacillus polymyxa]
MAMHGDGLGYEIVKAVINGEIIEPITFQKVKGFCNRNGILASENHMKVILSNATENTHSPTYKRYFERVGKGEYRILPEYRRQPKYYWLNIDSGGYNWTFSNVKVGSSQIYSNLNPNGSKRKNEICFKSIQIGDYVIAYETGKTKAITATCRVVDKYENDNVIKVNFQKNRDFESFLSLNTLITTKALSDCKVIQNHMGTLLEIEANHFKIILQLLDEMNNQDYNEKLNQAVQKSIADSSEERKRRLESRTELIPEMYETTTRVFKRNPDVIAEVLVRANGVCERCKCPAPFMRVSDGTPYLEVHHKIRLADGGEDTVDNAIAVCPNCHRELHFGFLPETEEDK